MSKYLLTIGFLHVLFLGYSQQRVSEIAIPMDMSTRRPIVEVTIDGKGPYKFIFDTGASTNVLDEKLSKELGFEIVGSDSLRTQGPQRILSQRVAVPNVKFPNTNISQNVEMNVVNLRAMLPIDGVLSSLFLKEYLITMDYPGSTLKITIGELDPKQKNVSRIIEKPRLLNYALDVDGNTVEAHLDTGSPGGFSLPYSMKDKLTFKDGLTKGGEIRTPVASYQPWHAQLVGDITVGNIVFTNPDVVLVEGFESANLGYAVIKDLRTTIDRKNNLIRFEKVSQQEVAEEVSEQNNDYTGWYGGRVRQIFVRDSEMYLKRGAVELKLESISKDLYQMVYHTPVNNELPKVKFERTPNGKVKGLTFIYADGRKEFAEKDE